MAETNPSSRWRAWRGAIGLLGILLAAVADADDAVRGAVVVGVVDGDTIRVDLDGRVTTVRLIGVDTPEMGDRHDRSAPPQPFARAASDFSRRTLAGQRVRLEFEPGDRVDKYGRTLAYVFLDDGVFFNRELLRQGYARAYARFPFRYCEQFLADEAMARDARRGLWAHQANGPVIGNRLSHLYHLPGQRHYTDVAVHNRVYFDSETAARAAGYEPARQ